MSTVTELTAKTLDPAHSTKEVLRDLKPEVAFSNPAFPSKPSELFAKLYHEVLDAVQQKPESAVISPSLFATSGVVPLSVISIIPDIMKQYADCIVASTKEVLIATNAWEPGRSVEIVVKALRELNALCFIENRKVYVKILMDAASLRNAVQSRYARPPESWSDISLPEASEIPCLDMEVLNYHVAPLGTFHSKFAVFDRKVALVNSCNINLRSNVEMMTRFEGAVVNSLYDTFLISWGNKLPTRLPCLATPALSRRQFAFAHDEQEAVVKTNFDNQKNGSPLDALEIQVGRDEASYTNEDHPSTSIPVNQRLNVQQHAEQTASIDETDGFHPFIFHTRHEPVPMVLVNRQPNRFPGHGDVVNPQNNAWLGALKFAKRSVFIQSPVLNASDLVPAIITACRRGVKVTIIVGLGFNDFAEGIVPFQGGTNEQILAKCQRGLRSDAKALENLDWHWYVAKDQNVPLRFERQARNCHVKFMDVDGEVAIMGSGNMDTQSWYHSQEVNVMIDSPVLCKDWREGFHRIQNSQQYGKVDHSKEGMLIDGKKIAGKHGIGGLKRSQGGFL